MHAQIAVIFVLGLGLWLWMFLLTASESSSSELLVHLGKSGATLAVLTVLGALVHHALKAHDEARREQEERHEFYRNVLADFKSVYDRVEKCRLLVEAHRSAKTYGEQLRELVGGVVTLHNIKRALDPSFPRLKEDLDGPIDKMMTFLKELLEEFRDEYREISHKQAADEAWNKRQRDTLPKSGGGPEIYQPLGRAWEEILKLQKLAVLRDDGRYPEYEARFVSHLDEASAILRARLPVREEAASTAPP